MKVLIPTHLHAYTKQRREVEARGATLAEMFADLDARFPGVKFRVINEQDQLRPHIRLFVNREETRSLRHRLEAGDEVMIVPALSGG